MSLFEFCVVVFVFVFLAKKQDIDKLKQLGKYIRKHTKKAKQIKKEINIFLTNTIGLSTKTKKHKEEKFSFVENDFTTKLIIPKKHQLKPHKNNR